METKPFTITSFEWKRDIEDRMAAAGEEFDSEDVVLRKLSALARFLDEHRLSTRGLTAVDGSVDRSFALRSTDITPEGFQLIRKGYESWHRRAKTPEDVRPLEKALRSIREAK